MILYYTYLKYAVFATIAISLPILFLLFLKVVQKLTVGRCRSLVCLKGKTAIVTGASSGIGFETALFLASRGCRVILADWKDCTAAQDKIIKLTNNHEIINKYLNLASLQSVRKFAEDIKLNEQRLDILINNASVGLIANKHTDDGLNMIMQINHLGPFLLTHLLIDLLKKSTPSRIVFVSSAAAFCSNNLTIDNLNPDTQSTNLIKSAFIYGNSKLCNVITANGFAQRLHCYGITANSLHPGLVNTEIHHKTTNLLYEILKIIFNNTVLLFYGKSPEEGAQTVIKLAISNRLMNVTGKHYWDCRPFIQPPKVWDQKLCDAIWQRSEELVHLKSEEKL